MSERFFCPHEGCRRSFAELWRLKVHCRAPPDIRGSGRERGHGEELKHCPRCQASLQAGRHHVGCSKGPVAPRQAAKRMQVQELEELVHADENALQLRARRPPPSALFSELYAQSLQLVHLMRSEGKKRLARGFISRRADSGIEKTSPT